MKTEKLTCRECKKKFTVIVKKKLSIMQVIDGLPNCRLHKKEENNEK